MRIVHLIESQRSMGADIIIRIDDGGVPFPAVVFGVHQVAIRSIIVGDVRIVFAIQGQ